MLPRPHGVSLAIGTPRTYAAEGSRKADALRVCAQLRQAIEDLAPDAVNRQPLAELHYG